MTLIDFKECFFTILLHEHDKKGFAFLAPTYHNSGPTNAPKWNVKQSDFMSVF